MKPAQISEIMLSSENKGKENDESRGKLQESESMVVQKREDQAEEEEEPEGEEGYARLSAEEHLQAWHYHLQIPVILPH